MRITKMLIVAAVASLALLSIIEARPNSEGEYLYLWNGVDNVRVTSEYTLDIFPDSEHLTAESLSCAGSTRCGSGGTNAGQCDAARRQIVNSNLYFTGGSKGSTGTCSGNCGLFVSGDRCDLTGTEMNTAYDELRNHGCKICGVKTYDDGCQFKMDYVTGC